MCIRACVLNRAGASSIFRLQVRLNWKSITLEKMDRPREEVGGDELSGRDMLERALHTVDEKVICGKCTGHEHSTCISFIMLL